MNFTEVLRSVASSLDGAPDEALAVYQPGRGIGPFSTSPKFVPAGHAWRLGMFLLDASGNLYLTGEVTRALEPGVALLSRSPRAEQRRDYRAAAARGKFAQGRAVNFDYQPLPTIEPPLFLDDGVVKVHLNTGGIAGLEAYLRDRASLLLEF